MERWEDILVRQGCVVLKKFNKEDVVDLANSLGDLVADTNTGEAVRVISPMQDGLSGRSLSSKYGMGSFPFHTELAYWRTPPRYLLLFCVDPGQGARPTGYFDPLACPAIPVELYEAQYKVRRSSGSFIARCLEKTTGGTRVRADAECMIPLVRSSDPLNEFLMKQVETGVIWHHWTAGDLLLLDNWRFMHGRGSSTRKDPERKLIRVMIS